MKLKLKSFQLVTLDCFYDTWLQPFSQQMFSKILQLKLKGYLQEYSYGTLPVDTTDFLATHHALCQKINGELIPVMAYKTMPFSRCRSHNLVFPALSILGREGFEEHKKSVQAVLDQCTREQTEISYDSSWTIDPEFRKDRELATEFRNIFQMTHILHHQLSSRKVSMICGILRFKTEKFFEKWGYEPLKTEKLEPLSPFQHASLKSEPAIMMMASKFTESAKALAENYREIWDSRILISPQALPETLKKVA